MSSPTKKLKKETDESKFSQLDSKHIISHYDPAVIQMHKALSLAIAKDSSPEVIETMNYALQLIEKREEFCDYVTSDSSAACSNILENTYKVDWKKMQKDGKSSGELDRKMITGNLEGQFLKSIVSMHKAKSVLEVGMFTGYGALSMAEALPADGEMVTVDIEKCLETYTGNLFQESPHYSKIKIHIGPALEYMKSAVADKKRFDIIFLDADKSEYIDYLKIAFQDNLVTEGGSVLIDNAFRHGDGYAPHRMEERGENNPTRKLAAYLNKEKSLHCSLVPIRDGVAMVRRMKDVEGKCS